MALFIPKNDPLIAEKLVDTTDAHLLSNFALVYDNDDNSDGFKSSGIGWVGLNSWDVPKFKMVERTPVIDVSPFSSTDTALAPKGDPQVYNGPLSL